MIEGGYFGYLQCVLSPPSLHEITDFFFSFVFGGPGGIHRFFILHKMKAHRNYSHGFECVSIGNELS